jgi:hypothetical protein
MTWSAKGTMGAERRSPAVTVVVVAIAVTLGMISAVSSLQLSVCLGAMLLLPLLRAQSLMVLAVFLICTLGLLRRLLSPGRVDYDLLLLLPLLLVLLAMLVHGARVNRPPHVVEWALLLLCVVPPMSQFVVGERTVGVAYAVVLQSIAFATVLWVANGRLPNVWPVLFRGAVPMGVLLAGYGIVQFFLLPEWDAAWMEASKLASVGQPLPRLVRVFGASESPGPYSVVLGLCIVIGIVQIAAKNSLLLRLVLVPSLGAMLLALLLTGVRTALVALACSLLFIMLRGRGMKNVVVIVGVAAAGLWILGEVLGGLAPSDSSVLTSDRYTSEGLAQDDSLQARLNLTNLILPAFGRPLGEGISGTGTRLVRLDSAYIDLLVNFGPIVLIALLVLVMTVLRRICLGPRFDSQEDLALGAALISTLVCTLSGNVFSSTTGLLVAVVIGTCLRSFGPDHDGENSPTPKNESRRSRAGFPRE